jgi:hypothetical protein
MKIETAIKKANFNDLVQISSNVTPTVTFWGTKWINVVGYNGKAPIDSLSARVAVFLLGNMFLIYLSVNSLKVCFLDSAV